MWLNSRGGRTLKDVVIKDKPIGTYIYSVDVGGGCYDEITINIIYCPVYIPNAFTPNEDGINDYFEIFGIDNYPGSKLVIYNRWGKKLFETNNYSSSNFWTFNTDGVYYYVLYLNDGRNTIINGSVTILGN
jgi:gliding motility-associated-like protein